MTGRALAAEGAGAVLAADVAVHRGYAELVREAVDALAVTGLPITAEDVRSRIEAEHPDAEPHHPNVLPAAMKHLATEGRLLPAGWREATRPCARGRALRVWWPIAKEAA